jgi:hypothetical protein
MNRNILIILIILILIFILYCLFCSDNIDKFSQNLRLSNIYGASSSRTKNDELYQIGIDDNNEEIYQFNNNTFKLSDDNIFHPYEPKKIKYLPVIVKIPSVVTTKSIKSKVPMKMDGYKFIGLVANTYYKQYYVIYEKEYNNYQREDKLYEYLLVKKVEDNFKVIYKIPPRSKVEPGDSIYFSYGNFQLGPLKFMY